MSTISDQMHPRWAHAAAESAVLSGQHQRALNIIAEVEAGDVSVDDRARLHQLRARLSTFGVTDPARAITELDADAAAVAPTDPSLAARLLMDAALVAMYCFRGELALDLANRARELAPAGDEKTQMLCAVMAELGELFSGKRHSGSEFARVYRRVLDALPIFDTAMFVQPTVMALHAVDDHRTALSLTRSVADQLRHLGALGLLPSVLVFIANLGIYLGDFAMASLAAAESMQLAESLDQPGMVLFSHALLALVAGVRDQEASCELHATAALDIGEQTGIHGLDATSHLGLAWLRLGQGRYDECEQAFGQVLRMGVPGILFMFLGDSVEALLRGGRRDEALERLTAFEDFAAGSTSRIATAGLLRCRGMLAEGGRYDELFNAAVLAVEDASPYEAARARFAWAERLAADRRVDEARAQTGLALAEFVVQDASAWASRATDLLASLSSASPAPPVVTSDGVTTDICALGTFDVRRAGNELPIRHGVPTTALKVVIARGGVVHAEELAEILWPASRDGRTRLRTVLPRVRALYGDVLQRDGDLVRLSPDVRVDATTYEAAAAAALRDRNLGHAAAAAEMYAGELLPYDRYADWAAAPRERLRRLQLDLLDLLVAAAATASDAWRWVERAVQLDPNDDKRLVDAARIAVRAGQLAHAKTLLSRAADVTGDLGLAPPPTLADLLRDEGD